MIPAIEEEMGEAARPLRSYSVRRKDEERINVSDGDNGRNMDRASKTG